MAVLSGAQKRGEWTPGLTHRVFAFWGGAELSFRDARLDDAGLAIGAIAIMGGITLDLRGVPAGVEVTIQAVAIMGGIDVTVDPDTTVIEDGFGFMGGFEDGSGVPRRPDGPRVRVSGLALHGRGVGDPQAAVARRRRRPRPRSSAEPLLRHCRASPASTLALDVRIATSSPARHAGVAASAPEALGDLVGDVGDDARRAPGGVARRSGRLGELAGLLPAFSAARPALAVRDPASNVASGPGVTIVSSPESNRTR